MALSLTAAHEQFIADLKHQHKTANTILAYGKDIAQFSAWAKRQSITAADQITPEAIDQFAASLPKNYTPKSVSRKLNALKNFCRFLHQNGATTQNPSGHLHGPSITPKAPRILSPLEYRALRDAARRDARLAAIVELLLQTGLRIGELAQLHLEDINQGNQALILKPYASRLGRTIPLNSAARQALGDYLKFRPRGSKSNLFVTKTGRPYLVRNIRAGINRLFHQTGIKQATVNDLRHTFIATQISAGIPLSFIAQVAGHKRLTTTETYLKYVKPLPAGRQATITALKLQEL